MDGNSKHRILVVDDDPDILNFIKFDFSSYPVELVTCSTVDGAIEQLGHDTFSAAIIDIVMGQGLSSEKLIKYIKEDFAGENQDLPVAVMSAHMQEDYAKKLKIKGSNVFATLKKPLKSKVFSAEILGRNKKTILLLEDDHDIISLLKNELENGDYQVFTSRTIELGERIVELFSVDLIVIDNKLGVDVDSSEFIEFIKNNYPGLPCILSGKDVRSDLLWSEKLNTIGTLAKPIERGELLSLVDEYFEKKASFDRLEQLSDNGDSSILYQDTVNLRDLPKNVLVAGKGEGNIKESAEFIKGGPLEDYSEGHSFVSGGGVPESRDDKVIIHGAISDEKMEPLRVRSLVNDNDDSDFQDSVFDENDINRRNKNGQTPIMIFCYLGESDKVKMLINKGADLRAKSHNGKSCLHYAAFSGDKELFSYLVQFHGLRVSERDNKGHTPMYDAIKSGDLEMVKTCVELGSRLTFFIEGKSYLTFAVLFGDLDIVRYLIDLGLDKTKRDYKGMSPVDYAIKMKRKDILELMRPS